MPLRLCSILGTVLLALAVASPVLAQGQEGTQSDTDDSEAATGARAKRKARAKAKRAAADEEAAEAKSDDKATERQGKRNKRKGKSKDKDEEEAEADAEQDADKKDADKDATAATSEASTAEAAPEPDAWERPPAEQEKPPVQAAPKAVKKPDHGGKQLSAGLLAGWAFETDRRSTAFSADPYGLGAGLRGGFSFDFNLYAGVYFMYYLGTAVTGSSQYVANPTITTNANYMHFGAEAGYDWWIGPVIVRPSLQLGVAMVFTNVPNVVSPVSDFMFAPGVTVVHPWDDYFIGGDLRANVVTGDGASSMLLALTFGMRFET